MINKSIFFSLTIEILLFSNSKEMFDNLRLNQILDQLEIVSLIKESNTKIVYFTLNSLGIIYLNTGTNEIKTSSLLLLNSTDVTLYSEGKYLAACTENNILELISENGEILNFIPYNVDGIFDLTITKLKCSISYKNNIILIAYSINKENDNLEFTLLSYNILNDNTINFINKSILHQVIGLLKTSYPYYFHCYFTSIPCCFFKSSQKNLVFIKLTSNYEINIDENPIYEIDSDIYGYNDFKISYLGEDTFLNFIFCSKKPYLNNTILQIKNFEPIIEEGYIIRNTLPDYQTWNGISYTGNTNYILGIFYDQSSNTISFENLNIKKEEKKYESNGVVYYKNNIGCSQILSIYIGEGKFFILLRGSFISTTLEYFIYEIPEKYCRSNIIKSYSNQKIKYNGAQLLSSFNNENERIFYYNTTYTSISIIDNKYIYINNNENYGEYTFSIGLEKEIDGNHILTLYENDCMINYYICHEKCEICDSENFEINGIYSNCTSKRCKSEYYYDPNDNTNCLLKSYVERSCYETCNTCIKPGMNKLQNCLSCKYPYILDGVENTNCLNCNYGNNLWYYDMNIDPLSCIILTNNICPNGYNYIISEINECVKSCPENDKLEYNNQCYSNCPIGTYKIRNYNKCCLIGYEYFPEGNICCLSGSKYYIEGQRCCDKNYYYNISGNICCPDNYIWDSKGVCCPYNYYADEITLFCCPIGQTYNRKDNYCCPIGSTYNLESEKCECDFYYYFDLDNNNNKVCLSRSECYNKNYGYLINFSNECQKFCNDEFKYLINNTNNCIESCPDNMYLVSNSYICSPICNDMYFPNGMYCECGHYLSKKSFYEVYCIPKVNTSNLIEKSKNEKELIDNIENHLDQYLENWEKIKKKNISIKVVNSTNEDLDLNVGTNLSSIYLGECEDILKEHYNLNKELPLIILQIDISTKNSIANKVEYRVYDYNYNLLDLSLCKENHVHIYYATNENANIDLVQSLSSQGLNVFDKNSEFYNSRCISFNINGNDVTANDRKNDVYNDLSVCESDCTFIGFNNETKRVKCDCDIKSKNTLNEEEEKEVVKNFWDSLNNQINYKLVICYNVFKKFFQEFYFNLGFWIYFIIFLIFIFCHIHYLYLGKITLLSKINSCFHSTKIQANFPSNPTQKNKKNNINNENKKINSSQYSSNLNIEKNEKEENNDFQIENLLETNNINEINMNESQNKSNNDINEKNKNELEILKVKKGSNDKMNIQDEKKTTTTNEEKKDKIIIYSSKTDLNSKLKEYNILVTPKNNNSKKQIKSIDDKSNLNFAQEIIFDSERNKLNSNNKNIEIDLSKYINSQPLISKMKSNIISNEKYKRKEDKDSIYAIKEEKQDLNYIKVSNSNKKYILEHLNTEVNLLQKEKEEEENKKDFFFNQIGIYSKYKRVYFKKDNEHNYQEMTFLEAINFDERNFFRTFLGFFFIKVEFISTIFFPETFSLYEITIPLYLLSLLIDFTLNALVYSDDVISQKYNNNGKLGFFTSILLATISNFFTFLIMKIIKKFINYSFVLEQTTIEYKEEKKFLKYVKKILNVIKYRIWIYFFIEIIISTSCGYYIYIFCNIYKKSQFSMLLNYLTGMAESLLISLGITLIVCLLRRLALKCKVKEIYYSSKFLGELI